jgi:transcriptional regulator with XRE-family HTH domain
MTATGSQHAPAISRVKLGAELRRLREARGLRLVDVAGELGVVPSTLCRIETGKAPTRACYLNTLIGLYGIDDADQRRQLADLAREGQRDGWWTEFADVLPISTCHYLGLESAAASVRVFTTQVIPGLLNAPGYAAAAWQAIRPGLNPATLDRLLAVTRRRQELLTREGFRLHVILDETALRRPLGTTDVLNAQLDRLATLTTTENVTLQILPIATPWTVLSHPFALLSYPDPRTSGTAATGSARGQVTIVRPADQVRALNTAFKTLAATALPPADSARLITHLAPAGHR